MQHYRALTLVYDSLTQLTFSIFVHRLKLKKNTTIGSRFCFSFQVKKFQTMDRIKKNCQGLKVCVVRSAQLNTTYNCLQLTLYR
jgi:hypothetical protein